MMGLPLSSLSNRLLHIYLTKSGRRMGTKAIKVLIITIWGWVCLCATVYGESEQKIFAIPKTETEEVVTQWLERSGYLLRRAAIDNQGIRLTAHKGLRRWRIALWPNSALATRVVASHTHRGRAEPPYLEHLWIVLDDHIKTAMGHRHPDDAPGSETIDSKIDAVVCIHVGYPEKPLQVSGFIIDPKGLIVCTAHGLKDIQQSLTVVLRNGRELTGRVVKIDKQLDLTLVDVQTDLGISLDTSERRSLLKEAESIYCVVCSDNGDGVVLPGIVIGPPRKTDQQLLWQVNMQIRPGSSGSPVFDLRGNLVGVVKGRYRGADKMGFLIPFTSLIHFLSDLSQ
jgi:serine protease Do